MRRAVPIALAGWLSLTSGCADYNRSHVKWHIGDLYPDLTLDPRAVPSPEGGTRFFWEIDYLDADGHGLFDAPVVGIEVLTTVPMKLALWGLVWPTHQVERRLRGENHLGPVSTGTMAVIAVLVGIPTMGIILVEDTVIHDVPITLCLTPALLIPGPPDEEVREQLTGAEFERVRREAIKEAERQARRARESGVLEE